MYCNFLPKIFPVHHMNRLQIDSIKRSLDKYDQDGSGQIDRNELGNSVPDPGSVSVLCRTMGLSEISRNISPQNLGELSGKLWHFGSLKKCPSFRPYLFHKKDVWVPLNHRFLSMIVSMHMARTCFFFFPPPFSANEIDGELTKMGSLPRPDVGLSFWEFVLNVTGVGKCPFLGILNITKTNICWKLYPQ